MDKESIKIGMRVHGLLASASQSWKGRWINSSYGGEIVKVEENRSWVKHVGIKPNLPYNFWDLARIMFLDRASCENKLAEVNSPKINLGGKHE